MVCAYNVGRGLSDKLAPLLTFLSAHPPDVVCLSETGAVPEFSRPDLVRVAHNAGFALVFPPPAAPSSVLHPAAQLARPSSANPPTFDPTPSQRDSAPAFRGVAMLLSLSTFPNSPSSITSHPSLRLVTVRTTTSWGLPVVCSSVYLPPGLDNTNSGLFDLSDDACDPIDPTRISQRPANAEIAATVLAAARDLHATDGPSRPGLSIIAGDFNLTLNIEGRRFTPHDPLAPVVLRGSEGLPLTQLLLPDHAADDSVPGTWTNASRLASGTAESKIDHVFHRGAVLAEPSRTHGRVPNAVSTHQPLFSALWTRSSTARGAGQQSPASPAAPFRVNVAAQSVRARAGFLLAALDDLIGQDERRGAEIATALDGARDEPDLESGRAKITGAILGAAKTNLVARTAAKAEIRALGRAANVAASTAVSLDKVSAVLAAGLPLPPGLDAATTGHVCDLLGKLHGQVSSAAKFVGSLVPDLTVTRAIRKELNAACHSVRTIWAGRWEDAAVTAEASAAVSDSAARLRTQADSLARRALELAAMAPPIQQNTGTSWSDTGIEASRQAGSPIVKTAPLVAAAISADLEGKFAAPGWSSGSADDLRCRLDPVSKRLLEPSRLTDPAIYEAPGLTDPTAKPVTSATDAAELCLILSESSPDKAPGPSGFSVDLLKLVIMPDHEVLEEAAGKGPDAAETAKTIGRRVALARGVIVAYVSACIRLGMMPTSETVATLIPIPKAKSTLLSDVRPIMLTETLGKLVSTVIARRLERTLREHSVLHPAQHGFRKNLRPSQAIEIVRGFFELHRISDTPGCVLFADLDSAFDSPTAQMTELCLRRLKLPEKTIALIVSSMSNTTAAVSFEGQVCAAFRVGRGVRQGDPLSPIVFNMIMDVILCAISADPAGRTSLVAFADDLTILGSSAADIARSFAVAANAASHIGLKFSTKAHKHACISTSALPSESLRVCVPQTYELGARWTVEVVPVGSGPPPLPSMLVEVNARDVSKPYLGTFIAADGNCASVESKVTRLIMMHKSKWESKKLPLLSVLADAKSSLFPALEYLFVNAHFDAPVLKRWDSIVNSTIKHTCGGVPLPAIDWLLMLGATTLVSNLYDIATTAEFGALLSEDTWAGIMTRSLLRIAEKGTPTSAGDRARHALQQLKIRFATTELRGRAKPAAADDVSFELGLDPLTLNAPAAPQVDQAPHRGDGPRWNDVNAVIYTDGSASVRTGAAAGAAIVWSANIETDWHVRPQLLATRTRATRMAQRPGWAIGAALYGVLPRDNVAAEAAAITAAVLAVPLSASGRVTIKSDSRAFLDELARAASETSHRRLLRSPNRAYTATILGRVRLIPSVTFSFEYVPAHADPLSGRDAMGNHLADQAAKHLAARGVRLLMAVNNAGDTATAREALSLECSDFAWPATTTKGHGLTAGCHVTGDLRTVMKMHYLRHDQAFLGRPEGTQSETGRSFTEGPPSGLRDALRAEFLAGLPNDQGGTDRFGTFWDTVSKTAKAARAALRNGGAPLSAGAQTFFARLISGTLLTLDAIGSFLTTPDGARLTGSLVAAGKLELARAGWRNTDAGTTKSTPLLAVFDPTCRLCTASACGPTVDSQAHFTRCPVLTEYWHPAVESAFARAVRLSKLRAIPVEDAPLYRQLTDTVSSFILSPTAHFTRRCGLFDGRLLAQTVKAALPDSSLHQGVESLATHLRLTLVDAAYSIFRTRDSKLLSLLDV